MRSACTIGAQMTVSFLLVTVNYRMVALGSYPGTIASDVALLVLNWTLVRRIVETTRWQDRVGYTVGGALGSCLGLWLTS